MTVLTFTQRPLLYKHVYEREDIQLEPYRMDWDNRGWDEYRLAKAYNLQSCGMACSKDQECFQHHWHLDQCILMRSFQAGRERVAERARDTAELSGESKWSWGQRRFASGWNLARIDDFKTRHTCEVAEWVRPSMMQLV
jgi:hypothetical protein